MGDKVLLLTKYFNVKGDKKLIPQFMGLFSIGQLIGPLIYWLNLGTH